MQDLAITGVLAMTTTSFIFEYIVYTFDGLIAGVGIQRETAIPAIFCYVFISLPSAWIFTFKYKLGIQGLFYGTACGQFFLALMFGKICMNIDWDKQVLVIQK